MKVNSMKSPIDEDARGSDVSDDDIADIVCLILVKLLIFKIDSFSKRMYPGLIEEILLCRLG